MNEGARAVHGRAAPGALAARSNDLFAGTVCGIVSLLVGLSYAALIFSGPLAPYFSYGITATFVSTAIAALVLALGSSIPFTIAGPESSTSAVTAVLSIALASRLIAEGEGAHLLGPTLIVISLGAALSGLFLCFLGLTRAGRAVRFVPYPVIGGFLGATGVLIVVGSIEVVTGGRISASDPGPLLQPANALKILLCIVIAMALFLGRTRSRGALVMPAVLLVSVGVFHAVLAFAGVSIAAAQDSGWLFRLAAAVPISPPWSPDALAHFPWHALPPLIGDLVAVMFVTTISALLNTTGIELAAHREANLNRELNVLGAANLLSAALGGYVSCISVNRTALGYSTGGSSRLVGLTVAAVSGAMLLVDPGFLGYVPKVALGGLLLYTGLDLLYRWLVVSLRQLTSLEYVSLVGIMGVIVVWGFIAGVVFGVVIGCATFALSASRVNAIKFSFDGSRYRSSLDRSPDELALLAAHGRELQGISLQSYLFFGSASGLYQYAKALFASGNGCRFLVFDFRLVTGIDSSAVHSFMQIRRVAGDAGAKLILVNLSPALAAAFRNAQFFGDDVVAEDDLDHALEQCESVLIAQHRGDVGHEPTLVEWLAGALESADYAAALADRCRRVEVEAGETIATQGAASDSMHFILDGRVGIIVDIGDGRAVRMRSLGKHTTIGEMGLLTRRPRSASVVAELPSVLYELSAESYDNLKRDNPALCQALLSYVVKVMGERLGFANQTIAILQR